jgi:hypothetical protein
MNSLGIVVLILIAFTIGYKIIGWLFDRVKKPQPAAGSTKVNAEEAGSRWDPSFDAGSTGEPRGTADGGRTRTYEDPETRYARVLGLPRNFTAPEIKDRYRTLIASYHPDKVNHLGPELQQMASQKTREIIEAYEYFRVKYNLK